jgi:hypothetical protein
MNTIARQYDTCCLQMCGDEDRAQASVLRIDTEDTRHYCTRSKRMWSACSGVIHCTRGSSENFSDCSKANRFWAEKESWENGYCEDCEGEH